MADGEVVEDKDKVAEAAAVDEKKPAETGVEATDSKDAEPDTEATETTEESNKSPQPAASPSQNKFKRLLSKYWAKKKWTLPATVLVLLLIILGIPFTRYATLGLFLKSTVTVSLVDSTTNTPVSSAAVTVGGHSVYTNAEGKVSTKLKLGGKTLSITKQYYKTSTEQVTVTFSKAHNSFKYQLVANGRQVPITVLDKITGKPVANAEIVVLSDNATASKTDKKGKATIVLPTKSTTIKATVSAAGYNGLETEVQVTDKAVKANEFNLVPSGKLYFLSNQSGKIDVVKTNLDGTDRQVVLAGTGNEDPGSTSLLASRDWKYLALLSTRTAGDPAISLIDTHSDKITDIDDSKTASFSFVGWDDDTFVYQVTRTNVSDWQANQHALKSYDAAAGKLYTLDQTTASGTSQSDWIGQYFGDAYIINKQIVYNLNWSSGYYDFAQIPSKQATLNSVSADGSNKKVIKSFSLDDGTQASDITITIEPYEPAGLYIYFPSGSKDNFYDYEDGQVKTDSSLTSQTFYAQTYPTYLLSPTDKQTFWSDQRDGKNALFVGDDEAKNSKQIATLSEYQTYGWFTDNYLLVSKNSSELYIMAADGSTAPQKISDYYKPPTTYRGYGGGYGGI